MRIDLGINFEAAQEVSSFKVLPEGTYTLQLRSAEYGVAGAQAKTPGRPRINWIFEALVVEGGPYGSIFYNTSLPWVSSDGQLETSGIGFLVNVTKALGRPWTGSEIDTAEYVGLTCQAQVGVGTNLKGEPQNEIKKFL